MAKVRSKTTIPIFLLFIMPAMSMLATYGVYFKTINRSPVCYDCSHKIVTNSKNGILNILDRIESYRQQLLVQYALRERQEYDELPLFAKRSQADLAFLQEKIKSIYQKYYSDNQNEPVFTVNQYENNNSSSNEKLYFDTSLSNRYEITRELNEFIFGNSTLFSTSNGRINLASTDIPNAVIEKKFPDYSVKTQPTKLINESPRTIAGSPLTNPNTPEFIITDSDLINDITIETVPLSGSQYFMILGLSGLLLLHYRSKVKDSYSVSYAK